MRIGILLFSTPGYSETFFTSKIKGLLQNGHSVTLFCQTTTDGFDLCDIKLLPKRHSNSIIQSVLLIFELMMLMPFYKRVKRFIAFEKSQHTPFSIIVKKLYLNAPFFKTKLDWVHFGFATAAIGREFIPKAIGAKMAVSFRGFDIAIYPLKNPGCYGLLWETVDKVHTISNDLLHLAYNLGLSKNVSVQKITPAIDINKFNPQPHQDKEKTAQPLKFLTVGRLHWKKGLIDTLKAFYILKQRGITFLYTIIGDGPQFEELIFTISQLGLTDEVSLLGEKSHKDVVTFMEDADIYIQYSQSEGFCNAVLEAQAMQLLCVVSDAEGLPENVINEETGFIVGKFQPQKLAEKIQEILLLPAAHKNRITKQAMVRVREEFNLDKQKEAFDKFYRN